MKTLLILISVLSLTACKGTSNKTSNVQNVSAYEQKAYLSIPHNDDSSLLREKLLHLKLASLLKQNTAVKVEPQDLFKFSKETFQTNGSVQLEIEKLQSSSAEIVVSYDDHLEIYFVPTGILRDQALLDLRLKTEEGQLLDWMPGTPSILAKGQTYYLLSASRKEILTNDQKFSSTVVPASSDVKTIHKFSPHQKILLSFSFVSFFPETTITSISGGPQAACKSDMREAGLCEPCMARIEKTTGKLVKQSWLPQHSGLVLMINGQEKLVKDFSPKFDEKSGVMTLVLELNTLAGEEKEVSVQFINPLALTQTKSAAAFGFSGNCRSHSAITSLLDLTPVVEMSYQMEIKGRNIQL